MKPTLSLAIQKKGRLATDTFNLLRQAGFSFELNDRSLKVRIDNFDLELLLLRAHDIPQIVADGVADLGITGQNTVMETNAAVVEIEKLGFGKCTLRLAFPENQSSTDLTNKRIATSYPHILQNYLTTNHISAKIIQFSGSVELAPKLDIADCICDLVSTGSTLRNNGLVPRDTILESQAVIIKNPNFSGKEKTDLLAKFLLRTKGVLSAQKYKYIVMNAHKDNLERIKDCLPGLKNPTVSQLANPEYVSIASVVEEDFFWSTIEKLKSAGACDILVLPIEKLIK